MIAVSVLILSPIMKIDLGNLWPDQYLKIVLGDWTTIDCNEKEKLAASIME